MEVLKATLEYGQGHASHYSILSEAIKYKQSQTKNYDCAAQKGIKLTNYHLHKILYNIKSGQNIQSIEMIFKNRNDGTLETLLNTDPVDPKENEYQLEDDEEIVEVRIGEKEESLIGFEITTSKGKSKKIGYGSDDPIKIKEFEKHENIIVGFGFQASQKYGVCSIYCYFMGKKRFGIVKNNGLLQLRAKLKKDPEFKNEFKDEKKKNLNEIQKLILNIADLPDTAFFQIASYLMTY